MQSNLEAFSVNADFSQQIENIVKTKHIPYTDAVILWCEQNGKEISVGGDLVKKSPVIKLKIQNEAEQLSLITKSARLPI